MQAIAFLPIACYITSTNNCLFSRRLLKKPRRIIIILLLLYQGYIVYFIDELSSFFSIFFLFLLLPFYCPPVFSLLFFSCCCFVQLFCFLLLPYAILLVIFRGMSRWCFQFSMYIILCFFVRSNKKSEQPLFHKYKIRIIYLNRMFWGLHKIYNILLP